MPLTPSPSVPELVEAALESRTRAAVAAVRAELDANHSVAAAQAQTQTAALKRDLEAARGEETEHRRALRDLQLVYVMSG